MNKAICTAIGAIIMFCSNTQAAEYTETLKPEAWNPINLVVVQADAPELLGIANSAKLPMREQPAQAVSTSALEVLDTGEAWGYATLWSLVLAITVFTLFTWINGPVRLANGFSGIKIKRWSSTDLLIHWLGAIACLALILTGIVIAGGRYFLIDWMSAYSWNNFIASSISIHNFFAIPFVIGWLVMTIKWARKQLPESCDFAWFKSLGGYLNFGPLKDSHPDAGFANAGEKLWFWCFALFGAVLVVSGLALMYPEAMTLAKGTMMWMLVLHCISAIILGVFTVVHIFMATLISEGGMENMVSGCCDENWAKQHHNLWHKQIR
ncbi:formate dehydrogenase subunit gamma [Shewanella sp. D64]|uniref:formate dehydrogenase subunit gamma n=1 Tax=unclassified Shewanella TaxID=196818 RepID=UPI0022BA3D3B|nr:MULTISPECIES: formate dehydrogenase subunit gamma [unclassified Shewanella]MEC4727151.1 formate dehydrogenase subunit gamma [Shewanella sp. D64]MEC4739232.1 formate dehydrogenase subunit gamma [Shewanella sp. E94]WBJ95572.1 formate dehydrogenase subunit gamma [Shewanella sp. MTB7]